MFLYLYDMVMCPISFPALLSMILDKVHMISDGISGGQMSFFGINEVAAILCSS